jgi:hypothetical protein
MNNKSAIRVLYIGLLFTGVLLGFAIAGRQPAAFYTILRWTCFIVFACSAIWWACRAVELYRTHPGGVDAVMVLNLIMAIVVGAAAVLFNPLIQFHHVRKTWLLFDKLALGLIVLLCCAFYAGLGLPNILGQLFKQIGKSVAGIVVAAFLTLQGIQVIGIMGAKARADGRVVDIDYESYDSDLYGSGEAAVGIYEFRVHGQKFYGRSRHYDEIGDTVSVVYNPQKPSENRAEVDLESVTNYIVMLLFGGYFSYWAITSGCRNLLKLLQETTSGAALRRL